MTYEYVLRSFEIKGLSDKSDLSFDNLFNMATHAPLSSSICIDFDVMAASDKCLDYAEFISKFPEFSKFKPSVSLFKEKDGLLTADVRFIERWSIDEEGDLDYAEIIGIPSEEI